MKMSLKPPALVVVMALTGRVGQSCAAACDAAAEAEQAAESSKAGIFMMSFRDDSGSDADSLRLQVGFLGGAARPGPARSCRDTWRTPAGVLNTRIERALNSCGASGMPDRCATLATSPANLSDDRAAACPSAPRCRRIGLGQIGLWPSLPEGRDVGGERRALVAVDREAEDVAGADELDEVADAEDRDRRGAGHHAVDRIAAAVERHAHEIDAVFPVEVLDERRSWTAPPPCRSASSDAPWRRRRARRTT